MEPWWKFVTFTMNLSIDYLQNTAFSHAWSLCARALLLGVSAAGSVA